MINQLALNSTLSNIKGSIFFSYKDLKNNKLGIKDRLRENAYKYPALVPTMPWLDNAAPSNPSEISVTDGSNGATVSWNNNAGKEAAYFVVYRFNKDNKLMSTTHQRLLQRFVTTVQRHNHMLTR